MEDKAIIKALLKLKDQKVNFSQAFAEREQTAKMFSSICSGISKSVRAFRSKNPKRVWDLIVGREGQRGAPIPQAWLAVQYGWKPALQDLYGSCELIHDAEKGKPYRATVIAEVRDHSEALVSKFHGRGVELITKVTQNNSMKVHLDYSLENPVLQTLAQWGITNPAALVWELLPYSFVVDSVIPIANYLSAMDAAVGWEFRGGTVSKLRKMEQVGIAFKYPKLTDANISAVGPPGMFYNRQTSFSRSVYGSSPLPRFPGIKNPFPQKDLASSSSRFANDLSLLLRAFR